MPFKSKAQRGYMWEHMPTLARLFQEETPKDAKLPEHVQKKDEKQEKKKK